MALRYNENTKSTNFIAKNIVFGDVKKFSIPASFQRIPMTYKYADGERKISIKIPESLSWGIQENKNKKTDKTESYAFSFVMYDSKVGPTPEETATINMLEEICSTVKKHLLTEEVKEAIDVWDKDEDIKRMSIMYKKKERGKIVEGLAPTLYPKLLTKYEKVKTGSPPEITTGFYTEDDDTIDPVTLIGVRCKAIGAVIVDNIYIGGGRFSIQLKLNDVIITKQFRGPSRLLESIKPSVVNSLTKKMQALTSEDSDDDDVKPPSDTQKEVIIYRRKKSSD